MAPHSHSLDQNLVTWPPLATRKVRCGQEPCKSSVALGHDTESVKSVKDKTDKLDFIKIKIFSSVRDTGKRMKQETANWEKIFACHISGKRLVSRIYMNSENQL